jgi:hypothetical protein
MISHKRYASGLIFFLFCFITANKAEAKDRLINQVHQVFTTGEAYAEESPSSDDEQKELREKLRKRIDTMKIWQLTEKFDLPDDGWRRFFKIMKDHEEKNNRLAMERIEIKHQLRKAVKEDKNKEVSVLLKKMGELSRRRIDIEQEELEKMKGILSIKQLAEYVLFRENFDHHINRLISKCKNQNFDKTYRSTQHQ